MKSIRIAIVAVAGALALVASGAWAQDLPVGMANAKNLVERTVTIDDQVYRVTGATKIYDRAGAPMRLEQVTTEADMADRVDLDRVTYAYDANGSSLALLRAVVAPR